MSWQGNDVYDFDANNLSMIAAVFQADEQAQQFLVRTEIIALLTALFMSINIQILISTWNYKF